MSCLRRSIGNLADIGLGILQSASLRGMRYQCYRVGNVEIPNEKRLVYSLQYIHGIGRFRAHKILCDLNMENKLTKDLSGKELFTLRDEVSKYLIEHELRNCVRKDIDRLKDIQCYRGIRHREGLPCRGQRTITNARTMKNKSANKSVPATFNKKS